MPTSNTSEVTRERAVLNYCIQVGLSIDIGDVIHNSLLYIIGGATTSGLGHPSLIDDLCCACGVVGLPSEEVHNPKPALTEQKISSYTSRFIFEGGESSSQPRSPPPPRSKAFSLSEQVAILKDKVQDLDHTMQEHNAWHQKMDRKLDHYMDQQMQQFEYMANFNSAMVNIFTNCSLNIGPRKVDFPKPPTFQVYTSQQEDDEEKESE